MNSKESSTIKQLVSERYSQIARAKNKANSQENEAPCCGPSCCSTASSTVSASTTSTATASKKTDAKQDGKQQAVNLPADNVIHSVAESYQGLEGYNPEADLGLGCGLPTKEARIKKGDTVLDLGSGAGNDCFIAAAETGPTGEVIGLDFSAEMRSLAETNAKKRKQQNIRFLHGEIENIPLPKQSTDVVISNCVMNLVPDKLKAYEEVYRVLKPNGHFSISDIVSEGEIPEGLKENPELYAECLSGAVELKEYIGVIKKAGFAEPTIELKRILDIPEEIAKSALSDELYKVYQEADFKLYSVTLNAVKQ